MLLLLLLLLMMLINREFRPRRSQNTINRKQRRRRISRGRRLAIRFENRLKPAVAEEHVPEELRIEDVVMMPRLHPGAATTATATTSGSRHHLGVGFLLAALVVRQLRAGAVLHTNAPLQIRVAFYLYVCQLADETQITNKW